MLAFNFDVSYEVFEDSKGEQLPEEAKLRTIARKHNTEITHINYHGPGGGNPNVFVESENLFSAWRFLCEVYGCQSLQDVEDYVLPIIAHFVKEA